MTLAQRKYHKVDFCSDKTKISLSLMTQVQVQDCQVDKWTMTVVQPEDYQIDKRLKTNRFNWYKRTPS